MPYRQSAEMTLYVEPTAKRFGLIVVPVVVPEPVVEPIAPAAIHTCKLPKPDAGIKKLWWQFFSKIIERDPAVFNFGDLWRCSECGEVYRYRHWPIHSTGLGQHVKRCDHGCSTFCDFWVTSSLSEWIRNGGTE